MTETELRLALRRAALRKDWTAAEQIGRRLGWRLLAGRLRRALGALLAPRRRSRLPQR